MTVGCFNRSGLFSALFCPTCRLHRAGLVCAQPGRMRGNRGGRVGKQKSPALPSAEPETCVLSSRLSFHITKANLVLRTRPLGIRRHRPNPSGNRSSRYSFPTHRNRYAFPGETVSLEKYCDLVCCSIFYELIPVVIIK